MPPSDKNQSTQPATEKDHLFTVTKGTVGPWPQGHTFAESEFKRIHPLPPKDNELANAMITRETYHGDLIGRLLALGVIEHAREGVEAAPTPAGPEARTVMPSNKSIKESAEIVLEQRRQEQAAMRTPEQPAAPLHTGAPPPAPVLHGGVQVAPQPAPAHPAPAAPPQ